MTKKKRLALARAAQKAARERRARAEAEEKAAVAYWLSGATRRVGDPLPGRSAVSSTERSHAFRARGREITIPRVRQPPRAPAAHQGERELLNHEIHEIHERERHGRTGTLEV